MTLSLTLDKQRREDRAEAGKAKLQEVRGGLDWQGRALARDARGLPQGLCHRLQQGDSQAHRERGQDFGFEPARQSN